MGGQESIKAKWTKYNLATSRMEGETKKWDDWGNCWLREDGRGSVELHLGDGTLKMGAFRQERPAGKQGTLFNLANAREVDGVKSKESFGTLFDREDLSGGAVLLTMKGKKMTIGMFRAKERATSTQAPTETHPAA